MSLLARTLHHLQCQRSRLPRQENPLRWKAAKRRRRPLWQLVMARKAGAFHRQWTQSALRTRTSYRMFASELVTVAAALRKSPVLRRPATCHPPGPSRQHLLLLHPLLHQLWQAGAPTMRLTYATPTMSRILSIDVFLPLLIAIYDRIELSNSIFVIFHTVITL